MKTIEINTIIQRNDSRFVATELGDELVMMDIESGTYIRLNKTAKVIWNSIKEPITAEQLVARLLERYQIEKTLCEAEVMNCLNNFCRSNILF